VIESSVFLSELCPIALARLNATANLVHRLAQVVYFKALLHKLLFHALFAVLLLSFKGIEALLETTNLVLKRGEISVTLTVLLDLHQHGL